MSRTPSILENWWVACCRKWWGSTWFWYLLSQNDYPANFIHSASVTLTLSASPLSPPSPVLNLSSPEADHKRESRSLSFWGLTKTSGVSQNTWPQSSLHVWMDFPLNVNQVKDTAPIGKQPNVVYHIPCSCGQVLHWRLEARMKEYWDTCEKGMMKLAVAEHVWENYYAINWEETSVLDRARRVLLQEALNVLVTPAEEHFNWVPRLLDCTDVET